MNEHLALCISSVYICTRIIAETIASLPIKLYETLPNGRQEATDADLFDILSLRPNPEMTAFSFIESMAGSLALTGNAYAQIQRVGGKVIALWPLHPMKTQAVRLPTGELAYRTTDGMQEGQTRVLNAADVIAIPLFSFDGLRGLSPVGQARQMLGLASATTKYGARFFGNGSKPGGLLTTAATLNDQQLSAVKESWQAAQGGINQGRTAVLYGGWQYTQIGLPPEDSQFLQTKAFNRTEIAALFQVPTHLLGDTSRLSNANHQTQQLQFLTGCIRPYLVRFEQEFHRKLLPAIGRNAGKYHLAFDTRELTRGDFGSEMAAYALGRQWGFFNANDVLQSLGENPIDGPAGTTYWMPVNMQDAAAPLTTTAPAKSDNEAEDENDDSATERSLDLTVFSGIYQDGLGRLLIREKRDSEAIKHVLGPVLMTLAAQVAGGYESLEADTKDRIIRDVVKSIEKRATSWTEASAELTSTELDKVIRSLTVNIAKEAAAVKALKQLDSRKQLPGAKIDA